MYNQPTECVVAKKRRTSFHVHEEKQLVSIFNFSNISLWFQIENSSMYSLFFTASRRCSIELIKSSKYALC